MDSNLYGNARRIAQGINLAERRGASGLETSVRLMQDIIEARKLLGKDPTYGAASMASLASATLRFAEGMQSLASCHGQLVELGHDAGVDATAYGDQCPAEAFVFPVLKAA